MRLARYSVPLLLLTAVVFVRSAMAQDLSPDAATRSEIFALVAAEDKAWNSGNAEEFGARVLPNVVFTNIVGMFTVGREPFLRQHRTIFSTIYKGSTNHQTVQHITLLKPDVAIVDTLSVVRGAQHVLPGIQLIDGAIHTRLEQVLVRRKDGWWVASFHNVAVNPVADQPPPTQ
ncbi:SgcJ/EcaC family oxidoreductase [Sphingomonas sp. ABOLG]|uniref:SgcJ/EcaC family oxidoreductase n=1 Tax=Sphingomonas sp. ABOLG TaxID=1985880 RepID=UPI000F7EBB7B|nr:SgcJ/EcaC family oxidoreductase [Sphingomonas sp. ABOLG]RSV14216.1 SgcJ/EcaC family oxidoreductase [Sphingomonas sp. ABOLG]